MSSRPSDDRGGGAVCVLDPGPHLEVTVERGTGGSEAELHLHPAGQGFWSRGSPPGAFV